VARVHSGTYRGTTFRSPAIADAPAITDSKEDGIIFYDDVTKVHVLPKCESFTVQIITPDLAVEMDFVDAGSVREALEVLRRCGCGSSVLH
jgi:hypothetical protein